MRDQTETEQYYQFEGGIDRQKIPIGYTPEIPTPVKVRIDEDSTLTDKAYAVAK